MFNNDSKFDLDLSYGKIFEKQLADILQNSKVEVKSERDIWKSTNNIAIEYESRGKKSGIATTEADYWFHNLVIDGELLATIMIPTKVLKRYIIENKPRVVSGGDDNTSKMFLINLSDLFRGLK